MTKVTSLEQFNRIYREYVRDYNTRIHSGIGCTPFERYQNTKSQIRQAKSSEWLTECFFNRITRKVHLDSTVSIDKISYDVPMQFIKQKVEIRYVPNDMSTAFILFDSKKFPIRITNKNENAHTKRNSAKLDYSRITSGGSVNGQ